jgi:CheY-like chemotaxis protein
MTATSHAPLAGYTILVVDDEPDELTYLCALLEDHGAATLRAADGDEALALARSERPDLMTLDLGMPGTSGIDVFSRLRSDPDLELQRLPICVITGRPELRALIYEHRPPPEGYLTKPVDRAELILVLRRLLSSRRRVRPTSA